MPEPTDEELGLDPEQMQGLDPNIRAELRRSRQLARDAQTAQQQLEQTQRELSFVKAGIPTDTPLGAMFAKAYDGDSDPAAIKAEFEKLNPSVGAGQGTQTQESSDEGPTDEELAAQRRIAAAGAAGDNDGSVPYEEAFKATKNEAEVLALLEQAPPTATDWEGRRITMAQIE